MSRQEDDVIADVVDWLREQRIIVIASGGNQATTCRFSLGDEFRKAPDLVAVRGELVLVAEVKRTASGLFRADARGYSDVDCVRIAERPPASAEITAGARAVLRAARVVVPDALFVVGGVVAGTRFSEEQLGLVDGLVAISVSASAVELLQDPAAFFAAE